ncbi:WD40 repeat protein [Ciborinia camelliae]|nr:WD40 repeat protein [Ciborinia camelliae]
MECENDREATSFMFEGKKLKVPRPIKDASVNGNDGDTSPTIMSTSLAMDHPSIPSDAGDSSSSNDPFLSPPAVSGHPSKDSMGYLEFKYLSPSSSFRVEQMTAEDYGTINADIPSAVAQNIQTMIIARFFDGLNTTKRSFTISPELFPQSAAVTPHKRVVPSEGRVGASRSRKSLLKSKLISKGDEGWYNNVEGAEKGPSEASCDCAIVEGGPEGGVVEVGGETGKPGRP